jgi:hypothetical protein
MTDFNGGMVAFKLLILRADTVLMTHSTGFHGPLNYYRAVDPSHA